MKKKLLLVTNFDHDEPEEDQLLAQELSKEFEVRLCAPFEASKLLKMYDGCLVRNAWPSRFFVDEFQQLELASKQEKKKVYSPDLAP